MNYIKGYRYELYCLAKNSQTATVTVYIDADIDVCKYLNGCREEAADRYTDEKISELAQRYEVPNPDNRWDSPLIKIRISKEDDSLPKTVNIDFDQIIECLFTVSRLIYYSTIN